MSFIIALFDHVSRRLRPNAGKQGDARRNKNTRHFTLRLLWSLDPTPRRTSKPALTNSCPRHPRPGPAATPSTRSRRRTPRTRGSNCHGRATTETRVTSGSRTPRCSISSAAGWTRGSSRTNAWETLTRRTASPSSPNRNLNRHRRQTGTATPATRTTTRTFRTCDLGGSAWFRSWTCST